MSQQNIIDKNTKIVLRWAKGVDVPFDPNTEEKIIKDFGFDEKVGYREYIWSQENQTFYKAGYKTPKSVLTTVKMTDLNNLEISDAQTIFEGWEINVEIGNTESILSKVFPFNIEPVGAQAMIPEDDINWEYGDVVDFVVVPPNDGIVGVTASDSTIGQEEISLSPGVVQYLKRGHHLTIGSEVSDYRIKSIDILNNKVSIFNGLNEPKNVNDFIKLRIYKMYKWPVFKGEIQDYATLSFGSTTIPAGYSIKVIYHHKKQQTESYKRILGICYHF